MFTSNLNECSKSELDMHRRPPVQTSIESGAWEKIECATLTGNTLEINIPASAEHYLDLSQIQLYVNFSIRDNNDAIIKDGIELSTSNNMLHSLFQNIKVKFNNKDVSSNSDYYPYKAYIENLLGFNKEAKNTLLSGDGWYKDNFDFECLSLKNTPATGTFGSPGFVAATTKNINSGFVKRNNLLTNKSVQLCGNLHLDVSSIDKFIMENNSVSIVFSNNKITKFFLGKEDVAKSYKIVLEKVFILVRRVKISPSVMLANSTSLSKLPAQYPFKRVHIVTQNSSLKSTSHTFTNISVSSNILPTRVIVGFVETISVTGEYEKNPFNFQNFGINSVELKANLLNLPYNRKNG